MIVLRRLVGLLVVPFVSLAVLVGFVFHGSRAFEYEWVEAFAEWWLIDE